MWRLRQLQQAGGTWGFTLGSTAPSPRPWGLAQAPAPLRLRTRHAPSSSSLDLAICFQGKLETGHEPGEAMLLSTGFPPLWNSLALT